MYKDYSIDIGVTDIARFTLVSPEGCQSLFFNEDGRYSAYLIDDSEELPEHYTKIYEADSWLWIFDDTVRTVGLRAKKIEVYKAGWKGCLIRLIEPEHDYII